GEGGGGGGVGGRQGVGGGGAGMWGGVVGALWVIDCSTKGPTLCAVPPTAIPAATATASVAPCWPNRKAAQISAGKTKYANGLLFESASTLRPTTAAIIAAASIGDRVPQTGDGKCAQTRISGRTTSAPDASPIQMVRQMLGIS